LSERTLGHFLKAKTLKHGLTHFFSTLSRVFRALQGGILQHCQDRIDRLAHLLLRFSSLRRPGSAAEYQATQ
jgi:hypothetical protein